jgi:hypothetical protein
MSKNDSLKFRSEKSSKQNIEFFFKYLRKKKSPFSKILLDALKEDLNENEFRERIKINVLARIKGISTK